MECRNLIEFEQMKYIKAMLEESPFPFEDIMFHSQCSDSEVTVPPLVMSNFISIADIYY